MTKFSQISRLLQWVPNDGSGGWSCSRGSKVKMRKEQTWKTKRGRKIRYFRAWKGLT